MALLYDSRFRALDDQGDAISGAKLIVKVANTSTDADIFTTAALSTPLDNPVIAGSDGYFAQIFAAEGTIVDLTLTDASDVTIKTYEDVALLGESSGTFTRDFTTSRARIADDGGTVNFEGGPASGDDIGGAVRVGGWSGTQADTLELDAAATSVTGSLDVTGAVTTDSTLDTGSTFTENGKNLTGVVYTAATAFAAVSNLDIPLTNLPAGVLAWDIDIFGFSRSADANLNATLSFDNGSTFKTGASDYTYGYAYISAAGAHVIAVDDAEAHMRFLPNATITGPSVFRIRVNTVASGSDPTSVFGEWRGRIGSSPNYGSFAHFTGYYVGTAAQRATHLRITPASGTISGSYRVVPLRGFN